MGAIGTTLGWSRPSSNTSATKLFPWYLVVTANRTVNVLILCGVEIKNIHNFDETWMTVPLWYKKINLIEKQQILIQKNLRSFITVKAHCSMTHLKQPKSFGFFWYSTGPWM